MIPEQHAAYIVACIREGGSMYPDDAVQFLAEHDAHRRAEARRDTYREIADQIEAWQNDADDDAALDHGALTDAETAAHVAVRRMAKALREVAAAPGGKSTREGEPTRPAPDFFQPGHGYTHRDGSDFYTVAVTTHPVTGEPRAFGWRIRNGLHEGAALDPDDWQQYDGCPPPEDKAEASRG